MSMWWIFIGPSDEYWWVYLPWCMSFRCQFARMQISSRWSRLTPTPPDYGMFHHTAPSVWNWNKSEKQKRCYKVQCRNEGLQVWIFFSEREGKAIFILQKARHLKIFGRGAKAKVRGNKDHGVCLIPGFMMALSVTLIMEVKYFD